MGILLAFGVGVVAGAIWRTASRRFHVHRVLLSVAPMGPDKAFLEVSSRRTAVLLEYVSASKPPFTRPDEPESTVETKKQRTGKGAGKGDSPTLPDSELSANVAAMDAAKQRKKTAKKVSKGQDQRPIVQILADDTLPESTNKTDTDALKETEQENISQRTALQSRISEELKQAPEGLTLAELRARLDCSYKSLIGLTRILVASGAIKKVERVYKLVETKAPKQEPK